LRVEVVEYEMITVQPVRARALLPVVAGSIERHDGAAGIAREEIENLDGDAAIRPRPPMAGVVGSMAEQPAVFRQRGFIVIAEEGVCIVWTDLLQRR